jgi:peroxiredoxin
MCAEALVMRKRNIAWVAAVVCLAACAGVRAQTDESVVKKELADLSFYGMPAGLMPGVDVMPKAVDDAERPAAIEQAAKDIAELPAGMKKVGYADQLAVISTQGQNGLEAIQAAADTLAAALKESPQPAGKDGRPAQGYIELAKIGRYANVQTALSGAEMDKAVQVVQSDEVAAQKADFTLRDLDNKKVTLSALKGKIVLVNFFATNCSACLREMSDLEIIHEHYVGQGVVILSISEDDPAKVFSFMARLHYLPQVLTDDAATGFYGAAGRAFHIDGVPRTFVFDREGKLAAESLDMCSRRQFFTMLGRAGLEQEQ